MHVLEFCLGIDLGSRITRSTYQCCFRNVFYFLKKRKKTTLWSKTYSLQIVSKLYFFRFKCLIPLRLIFIYRMRWGSNFRFLLSAQYFWTDLSWHVCLISKVYIYVYPWTFYSIPLVSLTTSMPILDCFNYHVFLINPAIG